MASAGGEWLQLTGDLKAVVVLWPPQRARGRVQVEEMPELLLGVHLRVHQVAVAPNIVPPPRTAQVLSDVTDDARQVERGSEHRRRRLRRRRRRRRHLQVERVVKLA